MRPTVDFTLPAGLLWYFFTPLFHTFHLTLLGFCELYLVALTNKRPEHPTTPLLPQTFEHFQ